MAYWAHQKRRENLPAGRTKKLHKTAGSNGSLGKKALDETGEKTGIKTMARFEIRDIEMAVAGGETR
ncbi:MAG TPA: sel1 repeat family protein, partial [Agrobacterium sp.]|nr:sel1 repeat family protein [Agrobacterium sp.]